MTNKHLLAPAIEKLLTAYAAKPNGSLLLAGPSESKPEIAVDYLLDLIHGPAGVQPGQVYNLEKNTINAVRDLLAQLALTRFDATKPRMIVITDCERLTFPAQNALLKGLEEPPVGSHFLLTSTKAWQILPTIVSRCQLIAMRPPLKDSLFQYWSKYPVPALEQAYWATDGWPSLMKDYLEDPESQLHREIKLAKDFLSFDSRQKLKYLFGKNVPDAKEELASFLKTLLSGLWRTARAALLAAAYKGDNAKVDFWRRKFLIINDLRSDFEAGLNHKVIILNLSLNL